MSEMCSFLQAYMDDVDHSEEITGMDFPLVHCRFDPDEAKFHTQIPLDHKAADFEEKLDMIYTAANAGNSYAAFLIHAAAQNQYTDESSPNSAFLEPMQLSERDLEYYVQDMRWSESKHDPVESPTGALLELDKSIARIEVILENLQRGLLIEDA